MKIAKIDDVTATPLVQQYQKTDNVAGSNIINNPSPEEKVNLSTTAKEVQKIRRAIDELPDVREEKILDLKNRIEQGTYKVDAEKIAEKMVGESLLDNIF
jgi:negative regulator of flagellin synthesis FlgM